MTDQPDLILASTSPRRAALLNQIGVRYQVVAVAVDESPRLGETPDHYVLRLAKAKARAVLTTVPGRAVLAADTTVSLAGQPIGKPADEMEAVTMLMSLSGRTHSVYTGVALATTERLETRLSHTRVTFRPLTVDECRAYWRSGEPADKAGGYAIQGLGAVFVASIEGSYSAVVGLPLAQTWELLQLFSLSCWHSIDSTGDLRRPFV